MEEGLRDKILKMKNHECKKNSGMAKCKGLKPFKSQKPPSKKLNADVKTMTKQSYIKTHYKWSPLKVYFNYKIYIRKGDREQLGNKQDQRAEWARMKTVMKTKGGGGDKGKLKNTQKSYKIFEHCKKSFKSVLYQFSFT